MNHVADPEKHDVRIQTLGGFVGRPPFAIGYHECRVIGGHSTARDLYKRSATTDRHQYISHTDTVNNQLLHVAEGTYCLLRFPR